MLLPALDKIGFGFGGYILPKKALLRSIPGRG